MTNPLLSQQTKTHKPFTIDEATSQIGETVFSLTQREDGVAIGCIIVAVITKDPDELFFSLGGHTDLVTAENLLKHYIFDDDSPCGVKT